jgi:hypothetical protein
MPFPHSKGQAYRDSNHLPLAVMWPRGVRAPGRTVDDYVSFIDLAPTFLEAAGVGGGRPHGAGAGTQPAGDPASDRAGRVVAARDRVLIGRERNDIGRPNDAGYPVRGIVQDGLLYLHNFEPSRWPACNPETGFSTWTEPHQERGAGRAGRSGGRRFWEVCFGGAAAKSCTTSALTRLSGQPDRETAARRRSRRASSRSWRSRAIRARSVRGTCLMPIRMPMTACAAFMNSGSGGRHRVPIGSIRAILKSLRSLTLVEGTHKIDTIFNLTGTIVCV